jgi:CRP-like cAMP-binding protein
METVEAAPGEVIVRQGEAGDASYLIEKGQADVLVHRTDGDSIKVGQLGQEEYFGEVGLLSGGLRMADVVAATPMQLLKLTRETFMRYLAERSEVEQQMAAMAARRIVDTGRKIAQPGSE